MDLNMARTIHPLHTYEPQIVLLAQHRHARMEQILCIGTFVEVTAARKRAQASGKFAEHFFTQEPIIWTSTQD